MLKQASVLMMWFISAFASALEVTPYIVNGSIVNISNYPSFASLFYRTATHYTPSSFCGATIINSRFVLTSAHCLQQDDEFLLHTVVSPNLEDESDFLSSAQAKAGAFYYPTSFVNSPNELWRDDIAIIELESPLPVDDLQYLLNSSINNNFPVNGEFYALGHGYINTDEPGGTELLKTQLSILSNTQCESVFGGKISDKQLCFGSPEVTGGHKTLFVQVTQEDRFITTMVGSIFKLGFPALVLRHAEIQSIELPQYLPTYTTIKVGLIKCLMVKSSPKSTLMCRMGNEYS